MSVRKLFILLITIAIALSSYFFFSKSAYADPSIVSGVSVPTNLANTCQGTWDQNNWNNQSSSPVASRLFPQNSGKCAGVNPSNVTNGDCNFYSWPQLWADGQHGTPQYANSCVVSWCSADGQHLYSSLSWSQGYTDGSAENNYSLYFYTPDTDVTIPTNSSSQNAIVEWPLSEGGQTAFSNVINGHNEWGAPGTDYPLPNCSQPPTQSSTTPSSSPSQAPSSGSSVNINLIVGLAGIGHFGTPPKDGNRSVTVELYDGASSIKPGYPGSTRLGSGTGQVAYDSSSDSNAGYFVTQTPIHVTLTSTSPSGTYAILIKIPQYLYTAAVNDATAQNPDAFTFNPGDTITTSPTTMYVGGISGNNAELNSVGGDDYTALLTCFTAHDITSSSCPQTPDKIAYADLDDNHAVDLVDFNILLRTIYQLQQTQSSMCTTTCNGD